MVAFAVLCGDFEVGVHHEKLNYDNVDETAENVTTKLKDSDLCLIHPASYLNKSVYIDAIVRRIQARCPELQIWGNGSSPPPLYSPQRVNSGMR
ncbi:MAG: hypothetical protein B6U72_00310 [Candidatus Altiarchaeales archaeon ex4484_2]|nr:MAG: hypothetical protein B6U72_00310 [Candidatus Altiarchaeales archaeon ex4484_2]